MRRTFIDADSNRLYRLRPNCYVRYFMRDTGVTNGTLVITSTDVVEIVAYRNGTPVAFNTIDVKDPDHICAEDLYDIMVKAGCVDAPIQEDAWEVFG